MFRKFKDKFAEEMKQSPARLQASMQQLAQAVVSPALSNSSIQDLSASNDNFSLTEEGDETPKNSPAKHGFQNTNLVTASTNSMGVSRRSSASSVTSDTSSLFPTYESPQNLYHLQSDMDQSASEVDDYINPQLDRVTKDQLYSAYRKIQARYHKYREKYTDLAAHYRELDRVKAKLESVLVETQDKVLRRIADLKEQCQLEQQAKAHLEEALRNDIEEKDHIIDALNTKVRLLQSNGTNVENLLTSENSDDKCNSKVDLIDLNNESSNTNGNSSLLVENEQLKDKLKKLENVISKYKDSLIRNKGKYTELMEEKNSLQREYETLKTSNEEKSKVLQDELNIAQKKITNLTEQVTVLKKREEESVISLAENKLSIHRELEDKEEQIKQLRHELKQITECKDNLHKTVDKYKIELEELKLLQNRQNLDIEKSKDSEHTLKEIPMELKNIHQNIEQNAIQKESETNIKITVEDSKDSTQASKIEDISVLTSLTANNDILHNLKLNLIEKETELQNLRTRLKELQKIYESDQCDREKLLTDLSNVQIKYKELKDESDAQKIVMEEKQKENDTTIEKLQATIRNLDKELENIRNALTDRDRVCEIYNIKIQEYATMLEESKEQMVAQGVEIKSLKEKVKDNNEIDKLIDILEGKDIELLGLQSEIKSCKSTISDLKDKLQENSSKNDMLNKEKSYLINNILNYKQILQNLKQDCVSLKEITNGQLLEQHNSLSAVNVCINTSLSKFIKNEENLKYEIETLQAELNNTSELKSNLEVNLKVHIERLNQATKKLEQFEELDLKNNKLITEINDLNVQMRDVEVLRNEAKMMSKEINSLKQQLEVFQNVESANLILSEEVKHLKQSAEEIENVKRRFAELNIKYEEAKNGMKILQSENNDYIKDKEELQKLRSEISDLRNNISCKDDEIKILHEKLISEEKQVEDLKYVNENNIKEIQELMQSSKTLQDTINAKNLQLKKLKTIKENQTKAIQEMTVQLNELKLKNSDMLKHIKVLEEDIKILKEENREVAVLKESNTLMASKVEELITVKEQITLENKNLKDKQNTYLKSNEELLEAQEVLKVKVTNYEAHIQDLMSNIAVLQNEIESYKCQLNKQNEDIQNLKSHITELNMDIQSKDEKLKTQYENIQMHEKEIENLKEKSTKENEILSKKVSQLTEHNESLTTDLLQLETLTKLLENSTAENNMLKIHLSETNKKVTDFDEVQNKNNELNIKQTDLENKIVELKNKIVDLENVKSDTEELQGQIHNLKSKLSTLEVTEFENKKLNIELQTLKEQTSKENNNLTTEIEELKVIIDEKVAELKLLDTKNSDLLEEIEKVNSLSSEALDEKMKEIGLLKDSIAEFEKTIIKLQNEVESLKRSKATLESELQCSYGDKHVDETFFQTNDKLQEENKKLEAQLDEALITFQAKESQMQIVNSELKSKTEQLKEELKMNEEEQSMRLKQLVKEFQAQLHDKEEELQAALEKRFDSHKNYESDLVQQYKEQLKDFQVELTAKSEQIENIIVENKDLFVQKDKEINHLVETIAQIKKEHANEIREIEKKWKSIVQQRTEKLEIKHEEEIKELTREWRNERRPNTENDASIEELESTSRVAMAAVQSNTGSFHTLQQTLASQRRELMELRKLVKLRQDTLEDSTEIEYLRNILFEYMMGRETMVLARVIAAVVKFDQQQTAKILKKEEDKLTLLGSLGLS